MKDTVTIELTQEEMKMIRRGLVEMSSKMDIANNTSALNEYDELYEKILVASRG